MTHTHTHSLSLPTHVGVAVVGLGSVFGAAIEETIGGGFRHPVGEVVDFHIDVVTAGRHSDSRSMGCSVCVSSQEETASTRVDNTDSQVWSQDDA